MLGAGLEQLSRTDAASYRSLRLEAPPSARAACILTAKRLFTLGTSRKHLYSAQAA